VITSTGKVTDDFYVIGNSSVPVYLLDGEQPVLFDAGFTACAQLYENHIKEILGTRSPAYLLLTHSHFDHVGSARYLKSIWPGMKIAGSRGVKETLAKPHALQLIAQLNQQAAQMIHAWGFDAAYPGTFEPFDLDLVLSTDQELNLGGNRTVKVMDAPGHTWDFLSYWLPKEKILVASEAVGCDDGSGYIMTEFLVDYDTYIRSLRKLSKLDVRVLCPGHHIVLTGPDAKNYMRRSLDQAAEYVAMVERFLKEEGGNIDDTVAKVKSVEWEPKSTPKQPEPAYMLNTRVRVTHIRDRLQKRQRHGLEPANRS